ncbi:hypothetical protein EGW08_007649, partial [Elysia chlorotica]
MCALSPQIHVGDRLLQSPFRSSKYRPILLGVPFFLLLLLMAAALLAYGESDYEQNSGTNWSQYKGPSNRALGSSKVRMLRLVKYKKWQDMWTNNPEGRFFHAIAPQTISGKTMKSTRVTSKPRLVKPFCSLIKRTPRATL